MYSVGVLGSAVVYAGFVLAVAGVILVAKPSARFFATTRSRGGAVAATGVLLSAIGLLLPAPEVRVARLETRLDEFAPAWQFREFHAIRISAPPRRVFEAIKHLKADEIFLYRTLTWIRRGGRSTPQNILNAAGRDSLIDIATRTGFVRLAEEAPRELVIGTVVLQASGGAGAPTRELFRTPLPPGFALATMNFLIAPDGSGGSLVSTETRVYASSPSARRRFAAYWRVIYPGSALIRRMWLRAIRRHATLKP